MKAYTDITQSKKLAEILPIESADMTHRWFGKALNVDCYEVSYGRDTINGKDIPCWSLTALLDVLESEIDGENGETYRLNIEKDGTWWDIWYSEEYNEENPIETTSSEELIDVCVDMIIKLKEMNLL